MIIPCGSKHVGIFSVISRKYLRKNIGQFVGVANRLLTMHRMKNIKFMHTMLPTFLSSTPTEVRFCVAFHLN
jgi:hypothetical protein